jgi:hypothetical protein
LDIPLDITITIVTMMAIVGPFQSIAKTKEKTTINTGETC